jgi:predicted nucleic acid-binding protein
VIHLDTNSLIDALQPGSAAAQQIAVWISQGEQLGVSAIAWSEFLCGPLTEAERKLAMVLVSTPEPFLAADAEKAAELFNQTGRRSRSLADCQIAAVAMRLNAAIYTVNEHDFKPFVQFGARLA